MMNATPVKKSVKKFNLLYSVCFALAPGLGHFFAGKPLSGFLWSTAFLFSFVSSWWIFDSLNAPLSVLAGIGFMLMMWIMQMSHLILSYYFQKKDSPNLIFRAVSLIIGAVFFSLSFPYLKDVYIKSHWQIFQIPSDSMLPTLRQGDEVITKMRFTSKDLQTNQIIIFNVDEVDQNFYIKRIIARPNDGLKMVDKILYRNDSLIADGFVQYKDENIYSSIQSPRDNFEIQLGDDEYFVMGDNRDNSEDSRFFGPIKIEQIRGVAHSLFTTIDPETQRIRWERLGAKLNSPMGVLP